MIVTMVVSLEVVVIACLIGVAVIPRFDRRPAVSPAASAGDGRRAAAPRGT